jgi:hypothetical protein
VCILPSTLYLLELQKSLLQPKLCSFIVVEKNMEVMKCHVVGVKSLEFPI